MVDDNGKLMICERDYWLYQRRNVFFPWAIKLTKRYEKGKRRSYFTEFDFTINLETVPNTTHSIHIENVHYDSIEGYVAFLKGVLREYTEVTNEDGEQLYSGMLNALID